MRPDGVASGTALSSSGLAELWPISKMSSLSSPSKYSPTRRPSPKAWMMVGQGAIPANLGQTPVLRHQPQLGAVKSSPGSGLTWAPADPCCTMAMLSRAA